MRKFVVWILSAFFCVSGQAVNLTDPPGNVFGDCLGGFVCSGGDPVLCAVAVADASTACMMRKGDKSIQDVLDANGFDKTLADVTAPETAAVSLGSIGAPGGSCPAAYSATVMGKTFTVDTAPVCDLASVIGWFVLLGAVVMGARILAGA